MNRFTNGWLESIRTAFISRGLSALFVVLATYSSAGFALTCKIDVPVRTDAFPLQGGNITVGNELPLGTIIYRQNITSTKDYAKAPHGKCDGSGPYTDRQYIYLTNMPQSLSSWQGGTYSGKIYNTNIPGIGVVIARGNTGVNATPYQWYTDTRPSIPDVQVWTTITMILIKTGNITPGSVNGSSLPTVTIRNDYTVANSSSVVFTWKPYTVKFSGSLKVISQTCSVPDYTVDLGSWDIFDMMSKGSSEWRDASIKMTNCPRFYGYIDNAFNTVHLTGAISGLKYTGNAIGLKLSALYGNINAANGIVKLEPSNNTASGVGIQLASGNKASNTLFNLGNEQKIAVSNSASTSLTIPLVARYIKTENKVTPGKADSKVIFTINYY
ncbi:TPA: fimbrial protein [Serratia fonticola]